MSQKKTTKIYLDTEYRQIAHKVIMAVIAKVAIKNDKEGLEEIIKMELRGYKDPIDGKQKILTIKETANPKKQYPYYYILEKDYKRIMELMRK